VELVGNGRKFKKEQYIYKFLRVFGRNWIVDDIMITLLRILIEIAIGILDG
jgi:hypothetical protein